MNHNLRRLLLLFAILLFISAPVFAVVTITGSASNGGANWQGKVYEAQNKFWAFYTDGTNAGYRTCPTSQSDCRTATTHWNGSMITLFADTGAGATFSTYYDSSNNVFCYIRENSADANFYVRCGTLPASGSAISWSYAEMSKARTKTASGSQLGMTIWNTDANTVWAAVISKDSQATPHFWTEVWLCTTSCGTNTNWNDKKDIDMGTTQSGAILSASSSSNVAVLYGIWSAAAGGQLSIVSTTNTGSTWSSVSTTSCFYQIRQAGALLNSGTVYYASVAEQTSGGCTNAHIATFKYVISTATFTSDVDTGTVSIGQGNVRFSLESNVCYLFYMTSNTVIKYQFSTDCITWVGETTFIDEGSANINLNTLSIVPNVQNNRLVALWQSTSTNNLRFDWLTTTAVIQKISCTTDNGGTAATPTLSSTGSLIKPTTTVTCDGTTQTFFVDNSKTLTLDNGAGSSTIRNQWASQAQSITHSSCSTVGCTDTWSAGTDYREYKNTLQFTLLAGSTVAGLTWTFTGYLSDSGPGATICSISPSAGVTSGSNTACWSNHNRAVTAPAEPSGEASPTVNRYRNAAGAASTAGTPTSGGNTYNVNYYQQGNNTYRVIPTGTGSPTWTGLLGNTPWTVTGTVLGTASATVCTISIVGHIQTTDIVKCSGFSDVSTTVTVPSPNTPAIGAEGVTGSGTSASASSFTCHVGRFVSGDAVFMFFSTTTTGSTVSSVTDNATVTSAWASLGTVTSGGTLPTKGWIYEARVVDSTKDYVPSLTITVTLSGASANLVWGCATFIGVTDRQTGSAHTGTGTSTSASSFSGSVASWTPATSSFVFALHFASACGGAGPTVGSGYTLWTTQGKELATSTTCGPDNFYEDLTFEKVVWGGGATTSPLTWSVGVAPTGGRTHSWGAVAIEMVQGIGFRWIAPAGSNTFSQSAGGNTNDVNQYYQVGNTYRCTPSSPTTWDAIYVCKGTGTDRGTGSTTLFTQNTADGGGYVEGTAYPDWNTQVTMPVLLGNTWEPTTTNLFTDKSYDNFHNLLYTQTHPVTTTTSTTTTISSTTTTTTSLSTTTSQTTTTETSTTTTGSTVTTNRYIPEVQTSPWFGPLYGFGIIGVGLVGFILALRRMRGWDRR